MTCTLHGKIAPGRASSRQRVSEGCRERGLRSHGRPPPPSPRLRAQFFLLFRISGGFLHCPGIPVLQAQVRARPHRLLQLCPSEKPPSCPWRSRGGPCSPSELLDPRAPQSPDRERPRHPGEGQPFPALQPCPGETCAARRHSGRAGLTRLRREPQGRSPSRVTAPRAGMPSTARWDMPQSHGTARPPSWRWLSHDGAGTRGSSWAGWQEPAMVPVPRAGLSAGAGRGWWRWSPQLGQRSRSGPEGRPMATTASSVFAGLWDSSVLFYCSSGRLHLLGSPPAPSASAPTGAEGQSWLRPNLLLLNLLILLPVPDPRRSLPSSPRTPERDTQLLPPSPGFRSSPGLLSPSSHRNYPADAAEPSHSPEQRG